MSISPINDPVSAAGPGAYKGDEGMKKASQDLEAVFYYYVIKAMRETVPKDGLFSGGEGEDVATSMMDMELAGSLAKADGTISAPLYDRLKHINTRNTKDGPDAANGAVIPTKSGAVAKKSYSEALALVPVAPTAAPQDADAGADGFGLPVEPSSAIRISSPYGTRNDPFTGEVRQHRGVDIAAPTGSKVLAAKEGRVVFSGEKAGYGNLVVVDHGDGLLSYYGHNSQNLVKVGDAVAKGENIALVGQTGRATGPHLHFEVRREGKTIDPALLNSGLKNYGNPPIKSYAG